MSRGSTTAESSARPKPAGEADVRFPKSFTLPSLAIEIPCKPTAWLRPVYLGLLVPHVVLAALVVPLALTTIHRAWRGRFDRHRRLARLTLPIWLYVSVSGVLVYVLLYHSGR